MSVPLKIQICGFLGLMALVAVPLTYAQSKNDQADKAQPSLHVPLASKAVFLDLAKAGDRIVAVGERGIIVFSDDDGRTWTQAKVPLRGTLTGVTFITDTTGIAVGHDSSIIRTDDGGATWSIVQFDPDAQNVLLSVKFKNQTQGYITGTNGQLLITADGGATWDTQTLAVEEWYQNHLFDIAWTDEATIVAAEKGVLYKSVGDVNQWSPLSSPYEGSYFGALGLSSNDIIIFGMSGRVYKSADSGTTWEQVPTGTQQFLFDAARLPDGETLLVGAGGTLCTLAATDTRADCQQRGTRVGFSAVLVDKDRVYLAASNGGISSVLVEDIEAR